MAYAMLVIAMLYYQSTVFQYIYLTLLTQGYFAWHCFNWLISCLWLNFAYNLHICYSYCLSHFYYKSGQERIGNPDLETQAKWNPSSQY